MRNSLIPLSSLFCLFLVGCSIASATLNSIAGHYEGKNNNGDLTVNVNKNNLKFHIYSFGPGDAPDICDVDGNVKLKNNDTIRQNHYS